ncbi:LysR family transcriptional regulator [Kineosporia sp. NBRC 101677]|nr:LysR family transcriptional regulator [Kineosporia sp. NBRC 101677]
MAGGISIGCVEWTPPADLNLLRTFLAVYRAGSFTAAAPRLGLSQPSVTTQVRALERHVGRALFTRLPRGVQPTPFAHDLAARVGDPLDALTGEGGTQPGRTSPIHLGGPSELLCVRVLPALAGLIADGVQLRVTQGLTETLLEDLRDGRHDLVIATRRPRGTALPSVPLSDEEYVLIVAPAWTQHLKAEQDLATGLRRVPLVSYSEDMPIVRRYWRTVLGRPSPPGQPGLTVPNLHAVVSAVSAGAGYSVVPRSICEEHLRDGRLIMLGAPAEPPLNTYFLVHRPGSESNPDVLRVREALTRAARADWNLSLLK